MKSIGVHFWSIIWRSHINIWRWHNLVFPCTGRSSMTVVPLQAPSPLEAQSFPVNQWCSVSSTFHLKNPSSCPKISWGKGSGYFSGVNFPSPFPPTKADWQSRWKSHGHQQPLLPTALPGWIFSTSFAKHPCSSQQPLAGWNLHGHTSRRW